MDVLILFAKLVGSLLTLALGLVRGILHLLTWMLGRVVLLAKSRPTTFGSARWARFLEIWRGGVLSGNGLIVGQAWGRFIRFNQDGYALLFAPTRSGKGVGVVVPNLLSYQGSIICTDPKGENSAITTRHRSTLGPVVQLNAMAPEFSDGFNPLDMVRVGTFHEADDALELAKLLVIPDSKEGHWDARSTQLLQGLILYTCLRYARTPELRNLAKIRSLVAQGWDGLGPVIDEASSLGSTSLRETMEAFRGISTSPEALSIMSNADKAMGLWAADRPAGMISQQSTFDFRDFNRQTMTCFIMVDEEKIPIYAGFLRVMMGCALMALTRAKTEAPPKVPTLLLLDEAAALGRIEPLETGVGYLAAYARLLLVFQDLDQLTRTYPKARSMIANAGCRIAFGVNDLDTARMLADTIGHTTTASHSAGQSQRGMNLADYQQSRNVSEAGRYLLDPSEILRLPRHKAVILFNGAVRFPVLAEKVLYFKVRGWRGRWDQWRRPAADVVPFRGPRSVEHEAA